MAFIAKLMDHFTNNLNNIVISFLKTEEYNKNEEIETTTCELPSDNETIINSNLSDSTTPTEIVRKMIYN